MREFTEKLKNEWADILIEGDYEQGLASLCTLVEGEDEKFCCLGVFAEEFYGDDLDIKEMEDHKLYGLKQYMLPHELTNEVNFPDTLQGILSTLNDRGATFEEIGRYLKSLSMEDVKGENVDTKAQKKENLRQKFFENIVPFNSTSEMRKERLNQHTGVH